MFAAVPGAHARAARYCEKPGGPGNFLAASPGVSCALAHKIRAKIMRDCAQRTRCVAFGFRCVAYWSGSFAQSFDQASHGLCNDRWRWVFYDNG